MPIVARWEHRYRPRIRRTATVPVGLAVGFAVADAVAVAVALALAVAVRLAGQSIEADRGRRDRARGRGRRPGVPAFRVCGHPAREPDRASRDAVVEYAGISAADVARADVVGSEQPDRATGSGVVDLRDHATSMSMSMNLGAEPDVTQQLGGSDLRVDMIIVGTTAYVKFPSALMSRCPGGAGKWMKVDLAKLSGVPGLSSLENVADHGRSERDPRVAAVRIGQRRGLRSGTGGRLRDDSLSSLPQRIAVARLHFPRRSRAWRSRPSRSSSRLYRAASSPRTSGSTPTISFARVRDVA